MDPLTALPPDLDRRLASVGSLQEPVRRSLYLYVLAQRRPVSRDEAASAAGVGRGLAAFHLDRLAKDGLLDVEYRRLTGRSGPGAGRPAKLYRPAAETEISLPPRSYAFAAELLAEALEARLGQNGADGEPPTGVAERFGRAAGDAARRDLPARPTASERLEALSRLLATYGYQPCQEGGEVRLQNCPFHALASRHTELVCGMNEAFLRGVIASMDVRGADARLAPTAGQCCVVIDLRRGGRRANDAPA